MCSLPQTPGAIRVLPDRLLPPSADGGPAPTSPAGYVIVAVLPGDSQGTPARVVTIDPAPLLRGAAPFDNEDSGLPDGGVDLPGMLTPCTYIDEVPLDLEGVSSNAPAPAAGTAWGDGLGYAPAGGVNPDMPTSPVACAAPADAGASQPSLANVAPMGGATVLDTSGSRPILYVADTALPVIHVIDLSNPAVPVELQPLQATSLADPARIVSVGQIAVSPTTRSFQRFLYAVDRTEGSLLIYEVTDPITSSHVPLTRPHPEINPFQPPDRILFSSPVASVAFVQHDWPLLQQYNGDGGVVYPARGPKRRPPGNVEPERL